MWIVWIVIGGLAALIAGLAGYVTWRKKRSSKRIQISSAGKGIDCREFVTIGGIPQYLHHRGESTDNPVMLFLHGGPGSPMLPFAHEFQLPWEKRVTVVHWDQRNSGKTYLRNDPDQVTPTTTVEQMVQDTREVVEHLQQKYGQAKIIMMGHSWGSVLGSLFVQAYPEMVKAYIGVGQVVNMLDNERIGFDKALAAARAAGNRKDTEALLRMEPYPLPEFTEEWYKAMLKLRKYQGKYKLAAGPSFELVASALCSPFYSFRDTSIFFKAKSMGEGQYYIWKYLVESFDLPALGAAYQVPVFYIHGERDWQTPYTLARDFFSTIEAPLKQFYSIPDAGHVTMLDQETRFSGALMDILEQVQ
ncbi:alpha/beta hydrolase [Paenibacillus thiaminolyticus]|uniref:alpha/beta fold hydrolase n=1 Tax=Paenibacillus thiaminolyticus TaxID=49283 RepID=UPI00232D752C|nr:alpha/beta hydrolase [Paenibacillus thiaminolyticus]WCF06019.1 alpha/beta hydrolase [Paenibacillus thiaminolyticus]